LTVEAILLSAQGKHKKESFAFAAFLATEGAAARLSEGKQSVAAKAPYDSPEAKADATLQVFLAQLKNTTPTPNIPAMNAVWSPFNQALEAALTGRSSSQDALAASQLKALGQ
jgi:arabinogalactan oligomer / maltooligosaccharide transport system substrate-binding protein